MPFILKVLKSVCFVDRSIIIDILDFVKQVATNPFVEEVKRLNQRAWFGVKCSLLDRLTIVHWNISLYLLVFDLCFLFWSPHLLCFVLWQWYALGFGFLWLPYLLDFLYKHCCVHCFGGLSLIACSNCVFKLFKYYLDVIWLIWYHVKT